MTKAKLYTWDVYIDEGGRSDRWYTHADFPHYEVKAEDALAAGYWALEAWLEQFAPRKELLLERLYRQGLIIDVNSRVNRYLNTYYAHRPKDVWILKPTGWKWDPNYMRRGLPRDDGR